MPKPDLNAAYGLETPEDSRRLYADWAETYDEDFAATMDFRMPGHVAEIFAAEGGAGPVLDVGAGTGLVGEELARLGVGPVDALDISPEMLAVAAAKGVYRATIEADLTGALALPDAGYPGVVSCGTFTTGHVGPQALDELVRVAVPGALFVIAINAKHFEAAGFDRALAALPGTEDLRLEQRRYYGDSATGAHRTSVGKVAVFRKR